MTEHQLRTELDTLLTELRSLGIETVAPAGGTASRLSIRPVSMDRRLATRIAAAMRLASSSLERTEPPSAPGNCSGDLSARQKEILSWVALGKSNSVIASILEISPHTVDTHLRRAFERLGTTDRTVAAIRGIEAGLIAPGGLHAA